MIRGVAEPFPQFVALALVRLVPRGHAVRFVHDDQVPVDLAQARQHVGPLGEVERGDDLRLLQPLVHAELVAEVAALEDQESFVELFLQLALPLEGQVGRADDQHPLGEPAQLEFADEQAGHDRLAGAGVVGQQEPHAGQFEQMVVNGLELVWQRIDSGQRQPEIRVELVGDAQGVCLEAEAQESAVAGVGAGGVGDGQRGNVRVRQRDPAEPLRVLPDEADGPGFGAVRGDGLHAHRLAELRPAHDLARAEGDGDAHRSGRPREIRRSSNAVLHTIPAVGNQHRTFGRICPLDRLQLDTGGIAGRRRSDIQSLPC